jgi:nitrate reductase NapAB chaperone NapD
VTPEQGIVFPAAEYIRDLVFRHCLAAEGNIIVVIEGANVHNIDSTVAKVRTLTCPFLLLHVILISKRVSCLLNSN